jgi:hypothetical protein
MKKDTISDPLLLTTVKLRSSNEHTSKSWVAPLVGGGIASIFCVIILTILLAIPITVLVIGTHYRNPRYCPIEPRISLFLIVHGSVSLGWIVFMILMFAMIIFFAARGSSTPVILGIILSIILFLVSIFSIIWLIVGSVWTFRIHNWITYEYDPFNHYYPFNYCQPVLYKFTYAYLIVSYVVIALQCCCQCVTSAFTARRQT